MNVAKFFLPDGWDYDTETGHEDEWLPWDLLEVSPETLNVREMEDAIVHMQGKSCPLFAYLHELEKQGWVRINGEIVLVTVDNNFVISYDSLKYEVLTEQSSRFTSRLAA